MAGLLSMPSCLLLFSLSSLRLLDSLPARDQNAAVEWCNLQPSPNGFYEHLVRPSDIRQLSAGGLVNIRCNPGYRVSGSQQLQCGIDGHLLQEASCEDIDECQLISPANKDVDYSSYSLVISQIEFPRGGSHFDTYPSGCPCTTPAQCVNTHGSFMCQCDGDISCNTKFEQCVEATVPEHGKIVEKSAVHVVFQCHEGHRLVGSERRFCVNAMWDGVQPTCEVLTCTVPPRYVTNGLSDVENKTYVFGDRVIYACDEGYRMIGGTRQRMCMTRSTSEMVTYWTGHTPWCVAIKCADLRIQNGHVLLSNSTRVGSEAEFRCYAGFELRGSKTRVCQANGQWSGTASTCNDPDNYCPAPEIPPMTRLTNYDGQRGEPGTVVTYGCRAGYNLIGSRQLTCTNSGQWSSRPPICRTRWEFDNATVVGEQLGQSASRFRDKYRATTEFGNPCLSGPCLYGGRCSAIEGTIGFSCNCSSGYTGSLCQTPPSPCLLTPCPNGNECIAIDNNESVLCRCSDGYSGTLCQIPPNPCLSTPCTNGGQCSRVNDSEAFVCQCTNGFFGILCEIPPNPCLSHPCVNGGQCVAINNNQEYFCRCLDDSYIGTLCQSRLNPCLSQPCLNGVRCIAINSNHDFHCECNSKYSGKRCQVKAPGQDNGFSWGTIGTILSEIGIDNQEADPCVSSPCVNGGQCLVIGDNKAFVCACRPGYSGNLCEIRPNPCLSFTCHNGGRCTSSTFSVFCVCINGYTGHQCRTPPSPCLSNPCPNGGHCIAINDNEAFSCRCANGYTGHLCQTPPNPCLSTPCLNDGNCTAINGNQEFFCTCTSQYVGLLCETRNFDHVLFEKKFYPGDSLDVIFILDVSRSVRSGDPPLYVDAINFVKAFIDKVGISPVVAGGIRYAVLAYASKSTVLVHLTTDTIESIYNALEDVQRVITSTGENLGDGTATASALREVRNDVITIGLANGRKTNKKVLFLLTDGQSNMHGPPEDEAEILKTDLDIEINCIGIGSDVNRDELNRIASDPEGDAKHVFLLDAQSIGELTAAVMATEADYTICGESVGPKNGGSTVAEDVWPWQAAIYTYEEGTMALPVFFCGGTLISPNWIMSAAHCFDPAENYDHPNRDKANKLLVLMGSNKRIKQGYDVDFKREQRRQVTRLIIHKNYNRRTLPIYDHDIALLELAEAFEVGPFVRTVCLPPSSNWSTLMKTGEERKTFATGWGKMNLNDPEKYSDELKQLALPIRSRDDPKCQIKDWQINGNLTRTMFCAGYTDGTLDACEGDSGGPLVRRWHPENSAGNGGQQTTTSEWREKWYQVGIISWGVGCASEGYYGYYTHLPRLASWVERQLTKNDKQK